MPKGMRLSFSNSGSFPVGVNSHGVSKACDVGSGRVALRHGNLVGHPVATGLSIMNDRVRVAFGTSGLLRFVAGVTDVAGGDALGVVNGLTDNCSNVRLNFRFGEGCSSSFLVGGGIRR